MAEDYTRGEMQITEQKRTFESFIDISVTGAAIMAVVLLFLTLVFATPIHWLTSLIITAVIGGVFGVVLKQGTAYWLTVVVLGVFTIIAGFIIVALFGG